MLEGSRIPGRRWAIAVSVFTAATFGFGCGGGDSVDGSSVDATTEGSIVEGVGDGAAADARGVDVTGADAGTGKGENDASGSADTGDLGDAAKDAGRDVNGPAVGTFMGPCLPDAGPDGGLGCAAGLRCRYHSEAAPKDGGFGTMTCSEFYCTSECDAGPQCPSPSVGCNITCDPPSCFK